KERLPLTYEAGDDVGLGSVSLEWQRSTGEPLSREIQHFELPRKSVLSTYDWDLPAERFRPGEIVRYRLVALDRNTVTGPGRAVTAWRTLEIKSFEQDHEALSNEFTPWTNDITD